VLLTTVARGYHDPPTFYLQPKKFGYRRQPFFNLAAIVEIIQLNFVSVSEDVQYIEKL